MKVYSVQSDNFLDNIDSEGYIDNETDKKYSIFDYKNSCIKSRILSFIPMRLN